MSDVKRPDQADEYVSLRPHEIRTDQKFNVRPYSSECTEEEDRLIEQLAETMEAEGQLESLLITPDKILIAGHRRRRAALLINERRTARGQGLFILRCMIVRTGDYWRKSILSNVQRKDNSAMDLAYLITQIRQEYGWKGAGNTIKVAKYLGTSEATIYTHERFLGAEKDLQNQIHRGILSVKSAMYLMKHISSPVEQQATIRRAGEIQDEDRIDKALNDYRAGKKSLGQTTRTINKPSSVRIEHPAIVQAIRERHPLTESKKLHLSRPELIQSIAKLDAEGVPESARAFARYWSTVFADGMGDATELLHKFLLIHPDDQPYSLGVRSQTVAS